MYHIPSTEEGMENQQQRSPSTASSGLESTENNNDSNSSSNSGKQRGINKRGVSFMDRFADSMEKLNSVEPHVADLERREREMKLAHDEQEFLERQDEKRRRLAIDEEEKRRRLDMEERTLKLQERQLEAQMQAASMQQQQFALLQALISRNKD